MPGVISKDTLRGERGNQESCTSIIRSNVRKISSFDTDVRGELGILVTKDVAATGILVLPWPSRVAWTTRRARTSP